MTEPGNATPATSLQPALAGTPEPAADEIAGFGDLWERLELLRKERQDRIAKAERCRARRHQWIKTVAIVLGVVVGLATVGAAIPTLCTTHGSSPRGPRTHHEALRSRTWPQPPSAG